VKVTAFTDVLSHWCLAAWPAVEAVAEAIGRENVELAFAPVESGLDDVTAEQEAWFYRRGTLAYDMRLRSDWYERAGTTTAYANAAVVAAVALGGDPFATTVATMRAAMVDGKLLGRRNVAIATVAEIAGLSAAELERAVDSKAVAESIRDGTERLRACGCAERPSFLLENAIGDRVVMQGVWQTRPLLAALDALRSDEEAYRLAGTPP
jgi:predicted DsbA family dithiol-disulfide isomerase